MYIIRTCVFISSVSSVLSLGCVQLFVTPWTAASQASLSITNSCSLLSSCPLSQWCHSTVSYSDIPFFFIRVFSNKSVLHIRWPKYWSFSFSISPSNEYSGLFFFRIDWLDLLAVQGTLKSLLQHHSSKASVLQCSAFFIVQLSHPYMTTGKTIAFTWQTLVSKVMSLLFNTLSRFVTAVLPRSKHFLISWLQSPTGVIFEPKKIVCHSFHCFLIYLTWSNETKAVYCHPAYLTYMQSTSWETLGWKKHKLESRLPGEISITSDMQMTPPLWQRVKRN